MTLRAAACLLQSLDVVVADFAQRCGAVQTSNMRDVGKFLEPRGIWTCWKSRLFTAMAPDVRHEGLLLQARDLKWMYKLS